MSRRGSAVNSQNGLTTNGSVRSTFSGIVGVAAGDIFVGILGTNSGTVTLTSLLGANNATHSWATAVLSGPDSQASNIETWLIVRLLTSQDITDGFVQANVSASGRVFFTGSVYTGGAGTWQTPPAVAKATASTVTGPSLTTAGTSSDVVSLAAARNAALSTFPVVNLGTGFTTDNTDGTANASSANLGGATGHLTTPVAAGVSVGGQSISATNTPTQLIAYLVELDPAGLTHVTPATRATTWDTLAAVTPATRATAWNTLAQVTATTRATSWTTTAQVSATRATSWTTLARTTAATRSTSWSTLAQVAATRATTWTVLAQVGGTRQTTWAALSVVTAATRATSWTTLATVQESRATTWAVASALSAVTPATRATTWAVLAQVAGTRATTWTTLAQAAGTRQTTWAALAQVTASSRATIWAVLSTVTAGARSTAWTTLAGLTTTKATTWSVKAQIIASRQTTWAVQTSGTGPSIGQMSSALGPVPTMAAALAPGGMSSTSGPTSAMTSTAGGYSAMSSTPGPTPSMAGS